MKFNDMVKDIFKQVRASTVTAKYVKWKNENLKEKQNEEKNN